MAMNAVLLGVDGNVLRLGVKALHEHLVSAALVEQLGKKLGEAMGSAVRVRIEKVSEVAVFQEQAPASAAEVSRGA